MAQYLAHELKRWHYRRPVTLGERSAFQVVIESNQVTAKPLDQRADREMNFRVPRGNRLGFHQNICQRGPIDCEGPRGGCRLNGKGRFARDHKSILADRIRHSVNAERFMVACRLQSPSIDLSMIPVSTPTFLGVYCRGALSRQLALRALSSDVGSPP